LRSLPSKVDTKHLFGVAQALFVTFLWSSSYVLIAIGLEEIPALTFAGLRYVIAAGLLLPVFFYREEDGLVRALTGRQLGLLLLLGLLLYTVTQGAQFAALQYLRAATVSLVLNFTPVIVVLVSIPVLGERPTGRQWLWIAVLMSGVVIYFHPFDLRAGAILGLGIMVVGLIANALSAILGRWANRDQVLSPLGVTTVSMGFGSAVLLGTGITVQGLPPLSIQSWVIVGWLAVVNTAFAFTLWNRTLQTLSAIESSVITNTMLVQIAVLGWVFLGESLDGIDIVGLFLVMAGAIAVQLAE
jgi:drug/metabolite transporter (DMT)-like permease